MSDPTTPPTDHIPADLFGGLLDGWVGPAERHYDPYVCNHPDWYEVVLDHQGAARSGRDADRVAPSEIRLPLTRPECRWQVARVLAAGERCEQCGGSGGHPFSDGGDRCWDCKGSGVGKRKPAPIWWALPQSEGGSLPNERAAWSSGLIACSARRVAAGLGPVVALVEHCGGDSYRIACGRPVTSDGMELHYGHRGMIQGPRAAVLANGIAIRERDGTLTLPWAEGVRDAR